MLSQDRAKSFLDSQRGDICQSYRVGMPLFRSTDRKLFRALTHAETLNESIASWQDEPHEQLLEATPDGSRHLFGIRWARPAPLDEWSLLVGDAIHNYRSALDHIAYALSCRDSEQDPPPTEKSCAFPLTRNPSGFHDRIAKDLADLKDATVASVEQAQPYRAGPREEPLLSLAELDNIDKHRRLQVVAVALRGGEFNIEYDGRIQYVWNEQALDTTQPQTLLTLLPHPPTTRGLPGERAVSAGVCLADSPLENLSLSETMSAIHHAVWWVRNTVESQLRAGVPGQNQ
jgi:hypothetical protein